MTRIPDGGHAEVEWGARFSGMEMPERVFNYEAAQESARAHVAAGSEVPGREASLVAREVTYGPWVVVEQAPPGLAPQMPPTSSTRPERDAMTTLTWREQGVAAFLSAQDGWRRSVTASSPALTALHAALDVAEPLIRAAAIVPSEPDPDFPATWAGGHALIIEFGDEEFLAHCQCGGWDGGTRAPSSSLDLWQEPWERHVMRRAVPVLERADPPATQTGGTDA